MKIVLTPAQWEAFAKAEEDMANYTLANRIPTSAAEARLAAFYRLPLKAVFFVLDTEAGTLLRHEVRRCPETGLTLTNKTPVTSTRERTTQHG